MTRSQLSGIWDWIKALLVAVVIALLIRQFVFTFFIVDGPSMQSTLVTGERVLVDKLLYDIASPKRGDVIVFHATPTEDYIKRIIGLPGDTIEVRNGQLYRNGVAVHEPYIQEPMRKDEPFPKLTVPPNTLFVMGDNRNVSRDSRIIGPVPFDKVIGRADLVVFPFSVFKPLW